MQFSEVSIVTPTALYVQICAAENQPVKRQVCIKRGVIAPETFSPEMRALGRHIAKCRKKGAPFVFQPCAGASGGRCYACLS